MAENPFDNPKMRMMYRDALQSLYPDPFTIQAERPMIFYNRRYGKQ